MTRILTCSCSELISTRARCASTANRAPSNTAEYDACRSDSAMLSNGNKSRLIADERVMVDAIANAARTTLSTKTSLTTRNTVKPLSVAR